jgi:hypothetical protein
MHRGTCFGANTNILWPFGVDACIAGRSVVESIFPRFVGRGTTCHDVYTAQITQHAHGWVRTVVRCAHVVTWSVLALVLLNVACEYCAQAAMIVGRGAMSGKAYSAAARPPELWTMAGACLSLGDPALHDVQFTSAHVAIAVPLRHGRVAETEMSPCVHSRCLMIQVCDENCGGVNHATLVFRSGRTLDVLEQAVAVKVEENRLSRCLRRAWEAPQLPIGSVAQPSSRPRTPHGSSCSVGRCTTA